jgi:hypothetical protein
VCMCVWSGGGEEVEEKEEEKEEELSIKNSVMDSISGKKHCCFCGIEGIRGF